jgi:hypothetical protein
MTVLFTVVVTAFLVLIGIAMWATINAPDSERRQVCYNMFCRLLDLFRGRKHP